MTGLDQSETDFLVIGSGCAGLTAALRASSGGLSVTIIEKAELAGGASAMSGGGVWIPANHHARAGGLTDSQEEALQYLRATAPSGWHNSEDLLWRRFVATAPAMLEFVEQNTPLHFALTDEPDPMAEYPGGKRVGRMVSPVSSAARSWGLTRERSAPRPSRISSPIKRCSRSIPITTPCEPASGFFPICCGGGSPIPSAKETRSSPGC